MTDGPEPASRAARRAAGRTATTTRRLLAALLAVTGVVAIAFALRPAAGSSETDREVAHLGTALWSVRRIPHAVTDAAAGQRLHAQLRGRVGANAGCFDVHDALGAVTEEAPDRALVPASTLKLLTATAALDRLGPDFRFTTAVTAPDPVRNGTVARLELVGGGDPLLLTPERIAADQADPEFRDLPASKLADLADAIVAAGVRRVPGGIVGSDDRYDRTRDLDTWTASAGAAIGPVGALTVNDGLAGAAGTGAEVADPARNAAAELTRLLVARGVEVGAPTSADRAAAGTAEIAKIQSPPLTDVLTEMLSASDNLTAEMLTRELGHQAGTGTTARGVQVVRDTVAGLGVDLAGATIVDGSGLSRSDVLRCPTLLQTLELTRNPKFAPVADGLAIAGERGTLADRLRGTPLAGNLRAKTGTLSGVAALAGFLTADRPLTFDLIVNGAFGESTAFALREAMATDIAAFGTAFAGDALVPAPNAPISSRACPPGEPAC